MLGLVFCPVFCVEQPAAYSNMLPLARLKDGTKSGAILFNLFFPRPLQSIHSHRYGKKQILNGVYGLDPAVNPIKLGANRPGRVMFGGALHYSQSGQAATKKVFGKFVRVLLTFEVLSD